MPYVGIIAGFAGSCDYAAAGIGDGVEVAHFYDKRCGRWVFVGG